MNYNKKIFRGAAILMLSMMISINLRAQVMINEYSCSNIAQFIDNHSDYGDWFELFNQGASSFDLGGYYLSDDSVNNQKWQFPAGSSISSGGFLRVWASGRDEVTGSHYHTNFKLTQTKNTEEYIVLSNASGVIIDIIRLTHKTQDTHSIGHTTDGATTWSIFTTPTPNASNSTSTPYLDYADRPDFDLAAGFYTSTQAVTITNTSPGTVIRFTIDGKLPTGASPTYTAPVQINETQIVKAITISSDPEILPSFIEFATYFINEVHTVAVVSISGTQLDVLANGSQNLKPKGTFEYFNINKERSATTYGSFNSHGQDSWANSQRSLDFISRDEMGYNHSIEEQLFASDITTRSNFQRIIMRASGDDNYPADHNNANEGSAHVRDAYIHMLAKKDSLHLDMRVSSKCVIYLNGDYWGVYDLRENPDEHDYTKYYYGQDQFHLQYIETWGNTWAEYGGQQALDDWYAFYDTIMASDMTDPVQYQYVIDRFDGASLIDYVAVNMFTVCSDWLNWNTGWWRGTDPTGTHKKWGYILWDNDATFDHYINYTGVPSTETDALPCDPEGLDGWSDPEDHIGVLNKLRENPDFENYYINRMLDLWNTTFSCENMLPWLDSIVSIIDPEMDRHAQRWFGTYTEWQSNVGELRDFIEQRCVDLTQGFMDCYSLTGPYDLTVTADPIDAGSVQLNSLVIDEFPWTGTYFEGIDTKLEAQPDGNNTFVNWTSGSQTFSPDANADSVSINLSSTDVVTAHFSYASSVEEIRPYISVNVYPTVFNNEIKIEYSLSENAGVKMTLLDLAGKEVFRISPTQNQSGNYSVMLNLSKANLASGVYLLDFKAGDYSRTVRLVCQR